MPDIGGIDAELLTTDLIVVALVLAGVLAYSYTLGKDHGVTLILALYLAAFPFFFVPGLLNLLPDLGLATHVAKIVAFLILFAITAIILMRNGFFESPMVPSKWEIGVFGILFTGLALTIVGSFLPQDQIDGLSAIVQSAFFGDALLAFWSLAPIGFWVLIKGD